jgi:hypothetical protein
MIGQKLLGYPVFLTYWPTILQCLMFYLIQQFFLWRQRRKKTKELEKIYLLQQSQKLERVENLPGSGSSKSEKEIPKISWKSYHYYYIWVGLYFAVNGIFAQFADPHVDGDLQQIISVLLLPVLGISARIYFK